jgi:uncharacterized membrane protein
MAENFGNDSFKKPDFNNPFQAPTAKVDGPRGGGEGELIDNGQVVPAGSALSWLARGWDLFKQQPGGFILVALVFVAVTIGLSFIPIVNIIAGLFIPVLMGGLMLACKAADEGEAPTVAHLFQGFSKNFGQLLLVGVLYFAGFMVIAMIGGVAMAGILGGSMMTGDTPGMGSIVAMIVAGIVIAIAMAPLVMALYYAPPLVIIHNQQAFAAMKMSFFGTLKNWAAFLLFAVIMVVLFIVASIPLGLGLIVMLPVSYAAMYYSYRDIYVRDA